MFDDWPGPNEPRVIFNCGRHGDLLVYRRCICGRFIGTGRILTNTDGEVRAEGWRCTRCGYVKPRWDWLP